MEQYHVRNLRLSFCYNITIDSFLMLALKESAYSTLVNLILLAHISGHGTMKEQSRNVIIHFLFEIYKSIIEPRFLNIF